MSESSLMISPPMPEAGTKSMKTGQKSRPDRNFAQFMNAQTATAQPSLGRNFVLAGRSPSDLMRMQSLNGIRSDFQMQAGSQLGSTLELARSMAQSRHIQAIAGTEAFVNRSMNAPLGDFIRGSRKHASRRRRKGSLDGSGGIGKLSAQFESGQDGIAAIGYDGTGGTSYGKYQIASKVGTMTDFLKFLDTEAPDLSKRLRNAGPANTGSRHGTMPDLWRKIAQEQPERFEKLQEAFATESHYKPALANILKNTGLEESSLSNAMREVIWSTAIQHGPTGASRIFSRANGMSGSNSDPNYERKMISNVYKIRAGQFGSSTAGIRASVQNRFKKEEVLALSMLDDEFPA